MALIEGESLAVFNLVVATAEIYVLFVNDYKCVWRPCGTIVVVRRSRAYMSVCIIVMMKKCLFFTQT